MMKVAQNKLFENTIEDLKLKLDTLKEEKSTLDIDTKNYKHIITSLYITSGSIVKVIKVMKLH